MKNNEILISKHQIQIQRTFGFCALLFLICTSSLFAVDRPTTRAEAVPSDDKLILASPGVKGPIPYEKFGHFENLGKENYRYVIDDKKGLGEAAGEGEEDAAVGLGPGRVLLEQALGLLEGAAGGDEGAGGDEVAVVEVEEVAEDGVDRGGADRHAPRGLGAKAEALVADGELEGLGGADAEAEDPAVHDGVGPVVVAPHDCFGREFLVRIALGIRCWHQLF